MRRSHLTTNAIYHIVKGTTFSVKTKKPAIRQEKKAEYCHIYIHIYNTQISNWF